MYVNHFGEFVPVLLEFVPILGLKRLIRPHCTTWEPDTG